MFCPTMEETDACMAMEGKMAMLLTLPAMLRAVEPTSGETATTLAMPVSTMKEKLTRVP